MLIFVGSNSVVFFVVHYPLIYVWIGLLLWFGVHSILLITASSFVLASGLCTVLAYVRARRGTMDYLYVMPEPPPALTRWAILPALRRVSRHPHGPPTRRPPPPAPPRPPPPPPPPPP